MIRLCWALLPWYGGWLRHELHKLDVASSAFWQNDRKEGCKEANNMLGGAGLAIGVASLVFGIIVMVFPKILNYLVGIYFIVMGVILILIR